MKKMMAALLLLNACSLGSEKQLYAVKLFSGETLYSEQRPREDSAQYVFRDLNGQQYIIPHHQVLSLQRERFKK